MIEARKAALTGFVMILSISSLLIGLSGCADSTKKMTRAEMEALTPSGELKDGVRVVSVQAKQYAFIPSPIIVRNGEQVVLNATSLDVLHGIKIPEFQINTKLEPGKTETIKFKADKEGSYEVYCSEFCGMGHFNMKGELLVLPAAK